MSKNRIVIYQTRYGWEGAAEFKVGRWPFRRTEHAPITHADTAEKVFAWLLARYPNREITLDPAVSKRYYPERNA